MEYDPFNTSNNQQIMNSDYYLQFPQYPEVHTGRLRTLVGRVAAALALTTSAAFTVRAPHEGDIAQSTSTIAKAALPGADMILNNSSSYNWAGYQATNPAYFDYITTDFVVPSVTCPSSGEYDVSIWAGAGTGLSDSDPLVQTGIRIDCEDGTETIYPWWEQVTPDGGSANAEHDYSHTVNAGDKMVAEVVQSGGNAYLYLMDYGSVSLNNQYPNWNANVEDYSIFASEPSTSECIVEDPSFGGSTYALVDFDTVNFPTDSSNSFNKACDVTANDQDHIISSDLTTLNHYLYPSHIYDMINEVNDTLATTSDQSDNGEFTVTWVADS